MKTLVALASVLVGGALALAPVVTHAVTDAHDKERLVDFYRDHAAGSPAPPALEPRGFNGYEWSCFGVGVGLAFSGLGTARSCGRSDAKGYVPPEV